MSKKQRIAELENEVLARDAQILVAERLLADKESVIQMYRDTYSELLARVDTLTTVLDKLSRAKSPVKTASNPKKVPAKR